MQLAGYLPGCIKRQCAQRCRAAWCALGINSLSCVCFSLIITYRTQRLVYLESNGEGCHARHTPINSHIDLCLYAEDEMWHLWPLLSVCQSVSLFTYHNSTELHLLNAIHINWLHCFLKYTEHKLKWSGASITRSKKKKITSYNGRVNHGNHIDPPITLQWMRSPPTLWGVPIDLQSFFQIQFLKKHSIPVFATSREVKQKFLVIWEGLEPWCFLFHILFLSPPLSG